MLSVIDAPELVEQEEHDLQEEQPEVHIAHRGFWPTVMQYVRRRRVHRLPRTSSSPHGSLHPIEMPLERLAREHPALYLRALSGIYSILKFFQVDITGMFRMTSSARYFKEGVGSSRPNWRWIMCFLERPKANTSCKALVKRFSLS